MVPHLTYPQALVVGLFQGVTELFPVSSLGHAVLIPALVGGTWAQDLNMTAPHSPYLAAVPHAWPRPGLGLDWVYPAAAPG